MNNFALIRTSTQKVLEVVNGAKRFRTGQPPELPLEKDMHWLPIIRVDPSVDDDKQIKTGPVVTVSKSAVTYTWTVTNKTTKEIDASQAANRDITDIINALVSNEILTSSSFPSELILRVNARNRLNDESEV